MGAPTPLRGPRLARCHHGRLSEVLLAAESRERGIRKGCPAGHQLLMDPDEIPLADVQ